MCFCIGHNITVREVVTRDEGQKQAVILQRWSTKWHCFVDTTGNEIVDGDNVTVREHICKPVATGGQQSKDKVMLLGVVITGGLRLSLSPISACHRWIKYRCCVN